MLVRDIWVFIGFAKFYWCFIQGFNKIAILLIFLLKTTGSSKELASKAFKADNDEVVNGGGSRANRTIMNLSKNKKSRKLMRVPNIGATKEPNFLTPNAKKSF